MSDTDPIHDLPSKPEFYVIAQVVLTVEADSAEEAERLAKHTLDQVDYWPTVNIESVEPFA